MSFFQYIFERNDLHMMKIDLKSIIKYELGQFTFLNANWHFTANFMLILLWEILQTFNFLQPLQYTNIEWKCYLKIRNFDQTPKYSNHFYLPNLRSQIYLLARKKLDNTIEKYKTNFDEIIFDTGGVSKNSATYLLRAPI